MERRGPDQLSDLSDEDRDYTDGDRSPAPLDLTDHKFLPPGGGASDTPSAGVDGLERADTAAARAGLVPIKPPPDRPTPDAPHQQVLFAEFLGTFFLVFICSACVFVGSLMTYDALTTDKLLYVSLGYGLMHGLLVYTLSFPYQYDDMLWEHTRHMNPAITLALLLLRRIHIRRAWKYWLVQALGAISATFVLFCCTPGYPMGSMETLVGTGYGNSFTMSLVQSSTVIFTLLYTTFMIPNARTLEVGDGLESHAQSEGEIRITVCSMIIICCAYTFTVTGGFMNPFITCAVAVLSGKVSIASLVGPFAAACVVVGIIYLIGLCQKPRTMNDIHRVPMIMKQQGKKFVLDSEADGN